jgi:hypothetical protein
MRDAADERRLRRIVEPGLEPEERIRAWSRAWVSRPGRLPAVLAVRLRHVVAVTDRRVLLVPVRYWTRRPQHRAVHIALAGLDVRDAGARRELELVPLDGPPTRLDVGTAARGREVADALLTYGPEHRDPRLPSGDRTSEHGTGRG